MNFHSSNEPTPSSEPEDSQPDTVGKRLPELTRELLAEGVHAVMASYGGKIGETKMLMVFLNACERPITPAIGERASVEIGKLFADLVCRRFPEVRGQSGSGTLEWNLREDTLEHQHETVTNMLFEGLG